MPAQAPTTQYARRLPVPTASPKGPSDSCRVVGVSPRVQLGAAECRASGMAAAAVLAVRGRDPQLPQGSRTPEASRRVQRALLKLELPDWFRQHYRPPRRDHPWLGDDGAAPQWPKWRALPGKDAKQPTSLRPVQVRSCWLSARLTVSCVQCDQSWHPLADRCEFTPLLVETTCFLFSVSERRTGMEAKRERERQQKSVSRTAASSTTSGPSYLPLTR